MKRIVGVSEYSEWTDQLHSPYLGRLCKANKLSPTGQRAHHQALASDFATPHRRGKGPGSHCGVSATMSFPVLRIQKSVISTHALRRCLATHAPVTDKDCSSITPPYGKLLKKLERVRELLDHRPLTLAEKILYSHLADPEKSLSGGGKIRGETYLRLNPQRVAMQDASAQ